MDVLHGESRRRYLETLSPFAIRILGGKTSIPLDSADGLHPSIAISASRGEASAKSSPLSLSECGLTDFTFGARYAVLPEMVNIFLDLNIPFGDEGEGGYIGSDEWAIYFGGQFYKELIPQLLLGVEAGLDWGFEHNDFERGLVFNTGAEIGYTIKEIGLTPFAGIEFKYKLTDDEWNGAGAWEDNAGDNQFNLWIGAAYAINEAMAVDGKIKMRSGDIDGDATHFDVNFSYNF